MTDLAPPPESVPYREPSTPRPPRRRNQRRGGIAIVMAASLALSAGARYWADTARDAALPRRGAQAVSTTSLSSMNSFALGLLLGGLRGPLVMILWTDSENQKSNKTLEGVDTEIEWIRLLQPEFDTVHLFQIWNKAYNISVQMASLANKYDTILGALDYAGSVDAQKPDDINIIGAIGQLFFDKLGTSSEKAYYRRRVREESMPHATATAARRHDVGWRRTSLDAVLDAQFRLLPSQRFDLKYLDNPRYQPYTDGVSTFGFAYNYYKRCERLMTEQHQHHDQLSDVVVDSRPGLSLKNWADDEVQQARRREAQAIGKTLPEDLADPDGFTASLPLTTRVVDPAALGLATDAYDRATRLIPDALAEYERHIHNYPDRAGQYELYMEEITAEAQMAAGDRDFLRALAQPAGPARDALLASARTAYVAAVVDYDRLLMRFYTWPPNLAKALPPGFAVLPAAGQQGLDKMSDAQVLAAEAILDQLYHGTRDEVDPNADRFEYRVHVLRCQRRVDLIGAAPGH